MPIELLKSLFNYHPGTGVFTWKVNRSNVRAGSVAGSSLRIKKPAGLVVYKYIRCNKKLYLSHRVAWAFYNGQIPAGMQIDHINRRPADNRITNLRLVTQSQNNINSRRTNQSGHVGVYKHAQCPGWCAELTFRKKKIIKSYHATKREAISARKAALESIAHLV